MEYVKGQSRSIMVIDDDRDDFELIQEAVAEIDPSISVFFVTACEDAVHYQHQHFDFVLLDINMPRHDGFFWLKTIRKYRHSDLPVIMFTNSRSPAHIAKAYEEGAHLYFTKPDTFSELKKGLQALITMDWSDPGSITGKYHRPGDYKTFRVA